MSEHELEKLLGGFAADTLTPEERQLLYRAALHDQQLFDALANEQALKELLTDPAVRRRLLQALNHAKTSGASSLGWLNWPRRPAGLAFAGGLAAAALAVVLGTKIYQDSLKQAAQSVATEDTKPETSATLAPPASQPAPSRPMESRLRAKENAEPSSTPARKDVLADKMIKQERSAPSKPQEQRASGAARDALKQPPEQDNTQRQADAASPAAPAAAPIPQPKQAPALSARTLFYQSFAASATEQERSQIAGREEPGRMAETPLQERKRAERNIGLLSKLEDRKLSAEKPLGIRYSLIMKGPGGIDLEVDPTTAVGKDDAPRLTVQTNESGYLSVLYARQSSDKPTVLFPSSGEGHVTGRKSVVIPLVGLFEDMQSVEQIRLHVVFSRTARESGTVLPAEKNPPRLLTEQVDPSQPGAPAEQAVYVVDPAPAPSASVSVEIPLSLRP